MKKIFHDIIPNDRRSIRNIPLLKKEGEIFEDMPQPVQIKSKTKNHSSEHKKEHIKEHRKTHDDSKIHHSVDGIRSKHGKSNEIESAFYTASAKDIYEARGDQRADADSDSDLDESFEEWRGSKKNSYWRAWTALAALLVVGVFIFSIYFSKATISINTVKHEVVLKESAVALRDVSHEAVNTEESASEEVTANGVVKVDRKATGKIVLYNAFNSATQKLVEETRLETPNGLVYKLKAAVSIPGQKTVNGKIVPGSVEAEVIASEVGEKYNQGFKDFNVVAYKNSDRYEKIYGRSKTALASGYSGTVPNILPKDVTNAITLIKEKINKTADEYFSKEAKSKGDGFVYLPGTKEITYSEVKQEVSKDNKTALVKIEAKITAVLFDSTSLFTQIIKNQTEAHSASSTSIGNDISDLDGASSTGDMDIADILDTKEIVYTGDLSKLNVSIKDNSEILVSGTTTISSAIESEKVKKAVSGLSKEQAIGAIKRLVELETIEINILPWWNKTLPSADRIKIELFD